MEEAIPRHTIAMQDQRSRFRRANAVGKSLQQASQRGELILNRKNLMATCLMRLTLLICLFLANSQ